MVAAAGRAGRALPAVVKAPVKAPRSRLVIRWSIAPFLNDFMPLPPLLDRRLLDRGGSLPLTH
jgi:hypothetical protein